MSRARTPLSCLAFAKSRLAYHTSHPAGTKPPKTLSSRRRVRTTARIAAASASVRHRQCNAGCRARPITTPDRVGCSLGVRRDCIPISICHCRVSRHLFCGSSLWRQVPKCWYAACGYGSGDSERMATHFVLNTGAKIPRARHLAGRQWTRWRRRLCRREGKPIVDP